MIKINRFDTKELKILRIRKGISQNAIAELIGISQNTFRMKELGQTEFTATELSKLAEIFEIRILATKDGIFFTN